jgi:Domain of unknown function (DUF4328)
MTTVPWVCGACRSINQPRESRCYRCRTPRDLGEVDPEQLITAGAGSKPDPVVRPMGAYQSSAPRALLTQLLVGAALVATVVASFLQADLVGRALDPSLYDEELAASAGLVALAGLGLGIAALVAWAAWLSRVVANVPKLGLGWPNVTPTAAIYESIFPGVNLYRVPSILRDVVNRLEPNGRGEALIAATWLALVAGVIAPRLLRLGTTFAIGDLGELTRAWVVVNQFGLGLTVAGGALLIVLTQWIESRMAARARALPAATADAPTAEPPEVTRVQSIAEAAGTALGKPQTESPASAPEPAHATGTPEPARPRWGGAVATPSHLEPSPGPSPEHGAPSQAAAVPGPTGASGYTTRYGDSRDDWLIGEDDSEA